MRRFFTDKDNFCGDEITFSPEETQHISKVLRLKEGEKIIASCGDGIDYECEISAINKICKAKIISKNKNTSEPKCNLTAFVAIIKNERMDYAIEKMTEIGVGRIVPVLCARTVIKTDGKKEKKQEKWQKKAIEACKQCGRAVFPKVEAPMTFAEAVQDFQKHSLKIVAYEDEKTQNISSSIKKTDSCAYFIGPEGGFTEDEHKKLLLAGAKSVSLGKRILRAETASAVCAALILCLMGEMDV